MPLCVGYLSKPCPVEAALGVGKERCRHCKALSLKDYQPEDGFQWCPGKCGAVIKLTRQFCMPCSSMTLSDEPADGFMRCIGGDDDRPCSHVAHVLKKNMRCKQCRKSTDKRMFIDFLQNGKHCQCNGCSECDWSSWWSWLEEPSKATVADNNCSRAVASSKKSKQNHEAGLCAFCAPIQ